MLPRLLTIFAEFLILGSVLSAVTCNADPLDESFSGPFISWKNVKDFGAVGNGVTDDTAAIRTALNALKNVHTNTWSVLYFPAGTYRITRPLTTSRSSNQDYFGADIIGADPNHFASPATSTQRPEIFLICQVIRKMLARSVYKQLNKSRLIFWPQRVLRARPSGRSRTTIEAPIAVGAPAKILAPPIKAMPAEWQWC